MPGNTSVTLGEHFDRFVVEKIKEGRFQSVSEVVRAEASANSKKMMPNFKH